MLSLRYRHRSTVVHRLSPPCKLAWAGAVLVFALMFDSPVYVGLLFCCTVPLIVAAGVTREWLSVMRLTILLCLAVIVINAVVSNEGSHVLVEAPFQIPEFGAPRVTLEAIVFGGVMSLRLFAIISAFAVVTFTIHPDDLLLTMIKFKVPYKSVLVTSLTTRFIPTLIDDVERITDAQRSRGLEMDRGNLARRIRNRASIIIPLLSNCLERATQVAEAMESRAFGSGRGRTFFKALPFTRIDAITLALSAATIGFGVFLRLSGHGDSDYYPRLSGLGLDGFEWVMLGALALLMTSILPMATLKRKVDIDTV